MPATEAIRVQNLRAMERAFRVANKELHKELRRELVLVGEPVRSAAQGFAATRIRNIGEDWQQMRVGYARGTVYVAPRRRGARSGPLRRPKFARTLMERAMLPALEQEQAEAVRRFDEMLVRVGSAWERA